MKYLLIIFLSSCSAAVAPAVKDTVYRTDTVYVPYERHWEDSSVSGYYWQNGHGQDWQGRYWPDKDSLVVYGDKDSLIRSLLRKLYDCQ